MIDRKRENETPAFDIDDREYRVTAHYLEDTETDKGDALIQIFHRDLMIREFLFPSYKIWNIHAHFSDIVDSEIAKDDHGYRLAAWSGIGPL